MELGVGNQISELNTELIKKQNMTFWGTKVSEIGKNEICIPFSDLELQLLFAWRGSNILGILGDDPLVYDFE